MSLYLLATQPELLKQLQTGEYWDTVADEVIRLASPTMHFRRTATQDIELHGKQIREGDKVNFEIGHGPKGLIALEVKLI